MRRSLLDHQEFKLQFAGHETFPLRYGWIKKSIDAVEEELNKSNCDLKSIFTSEEAIGRFGVGKNMVVSMRYWATAAGFIRGEDCHPTEFGRLINGKMGDPYLEFAASLWLIHWNIASTPSRTTTWYWAFNELNEATFDRDLLQQRMKRSFSELRESGRVKEARVTETTIKRDIDCFIRTYVARSGNGRGSAEDNLECPLAELSLIQSTEVGGAYQFRRGPKPTLPDDVFLYALFQYWKTFHPTRREFSVSSLTHDPGSPGRVFLLDEDSIAERLLAISNISEGVIRLDESSGMRQAYAENLGAVEPLKYLTAMYLRNNQSQAA